MWWCESLDVVLVANGIYDLCCGAAILWRPRHIVARLHAGLFAPIYRTPLCRRLLAYWILTYATPRLLAGLARHPALDLLCAHTYLAEGAAYHAERRRGVATGVCTYFVIWTSYGLGAAAVARACVHYL